MAENEHEAPAAPKGIINSTDPFEVIIFLLLAVTVGGYVIERVIALWPSDKPFLEIVKTYLLGLIPASLFISAAFFIGVVYAIRQLTRINGTLHTKFHCAHGHHETHEEHHEASAVSEERVNKRWQKVLEYINSPTMDDWKLAIIEADIILEELIDEIGYRGESLGEKLKAVEQSDFTTIDKAWEAHKIRNTIAHEGASFIITEREARRVIALFEEVFKEFKYI